MGPSSTAAQKSDNGQDTEYKSVLGSIVSGDDQVDPSYVSAFPFSSTAVQKVGDAQETAVGSPSYEVLTGSYDTAVARWESTPLAVGRAIAAPKPVFTKLDPSIVDEELARLEP